MDGAVKLTFAPRLQQQVHDAGDDIDREQAGGGDQYDAGVRTIGMPNFLKSKLADECIRNE